MKVCSNFTGMEKVHKEADVVVKKTMAKELKTLIPDLVKGAMSVGILRWAMNQPNSGNARQRAKWAKYREYKHPNDNCAAVYWTTIIFVDPAEEEDDVQMVARA
ncbi:Chitinase domain-containing protein 1 [Hordeum vulgare]|nr:Chitinase domain-containing protein 1 [Hordeum vulgare]